MLLLPEVGICCTSAMALRLSISKLPTTEKFRVKFAPGERWSSSQVAASTMAGTTSCFTAEARAATNPFISELSEVEELRGDQRAVRANVSASTALKSIGRL